MRNRLEDSATLAGTRKEDHIRICKTQDVESAGTPFSRYEFLPEALPELDFARLNCEQTFLGNVFSMPLLITGMTGGVERGQEINEVLACAAQKFSIPMGLGSQKILLQDPSLHPLFDVRKRAPKVFLIGNMGAVSLNYGVRPDQLKKLCEDFELNAFALHVNALQECIQPEGERNFANLIKKIEDVVKALEIPILVKEVGSGMTEKTFAHLVNAGVHAVDVGGKGGTSWSAIEGMRGGSDGLRLGELFRNWGLSTDASLVRCHAVKKERGFATELVATGGMRNGLQVAKAVALGASMAGVGLPLFRAATAPKNGESAFEAVEKELFFFKESLLIAMFCSGAQNLSELAARIELKNDGDTKWQKN